MNLKDTGKEKEYRSLGVVKDGRNTVIIITYTQTNQNKKGTFLYLHFHLEIYSTKAEIWESPTSIIQMHVCRESLTRDSRAFHLLVQWGRQITWRLVIEELKDFFFVPYIPRIPVSLGPNFFLQTRMCISYFLYGV